MFDFGEIEVITSSSLKDIQDVQASSFKVRSSVVGFGDKELVRGSVLDRLENVTDLDELLHDGSEQGQAGLDFGFGVVRLHGGGDDGNEPAPGRHLMSVAHHGNVDVGAAADLLLRNDDLRGEGILIN